GFGYLWIVGENEHAGDGPLDTHRFGQWKQTRQFGQTFAIGKVVTGESVQGANLRTDFGHARDAHGNNTKLLHIGDWPVTQINLGNLDVLIAGAGQRLQDASAGFGASQAGQNRSMRHLASLPWSQFEALPLLIQ